MCSRLARAATGLSTVAALALTIGAWMPAAAAGPAVPSPGAHQLFDTTTAAPRPGIPRGAKATLLAHPRAGVRAATASSSGAPPDPEVLGFAMNGEVTSGAWQQDIQMPLVSTIAYFALSFNNDGSFADDAGYQGYWSAQATAMINAAHSAGDRVVVTVKAFTNATIAAVTQTSAATQAAVANIVSQVAQRGTDGVNIDFEGTDPSVASSYTAFVAQVQAALHSQVPNQSYLTVDTYASSASGGTMMDIHGLSPYVDAFDVMAYDMSTASSAHAGPNAPLSPGSSGEPQFTYADVNTVQQYTAIVPASQVILGVPYYGYKWSVASPAEGAATVPGTGGAVTYTDLTSDFSCAEQLQESFDTGYGVPWATWYSPATNDPCGGNWNSYRELFYDNAASLGEKYDLVNSSGLRGIGIWALGYDTGHSELWNEIAAKFTVTHAPTPAMTALPATESSTAFTLHWSVPSGSEPVQRYVVSVRDGSSPWQTWTQTASTSSDFFGNPGHTYDFFVESFTASGANSGAPGAQPMTSTQVSQSATRSSAQPPVSVYAVDGYGNLHGASSPPLGPGTLFAGWDIVRGLTVAKGGAGGLVLDGWGGLHPFGDSAAPSGSAYWQGWDITRGVASVGGGGYVLDGWGGVHPYTLAGPAPPAAQGTAYWPGWDIARGIVTFADGSGGLVLDGWGGLHPFAAGGGQIAPPVASAYWQGWDIARGLVLLAGSTSSSYAGFVLDGRGGLHPFASQGAAAPSAPSITGYWQNDVARGVVLLPGTTQGYVVDLLGGFWPTGGAPRVEAPTYDLDGGTVRGGATG